MRDKSLYIPDKVIPEQPAVMATAASASTLGPVVVPVGESKVYHLTVPNASGQLALKQDCHT